MSLRTQILERLKDTIVLCLSGTQYEQASQFISSIIDVAKAAEELEQAHIIALTEELADYAELGTYEELADLVSRAEIIRHTEEYEDNIVIL